MDQTNLRFKRSVVLLQMSVLVPQDFEDIRPLLRRVYVDGRLLALAEDFVIVMAPIVF